MRTEVYYFVNFFFVHVDVGLSLKVFYISDLFIRL